MTCAVRVSSLGKKYRLGQREAARTLGETLSRAALAPVRALAALRRRSEATQPGQFWALRDVSFEVERGEMVGVIGHNGAGKSTLLKVLSRITQPTTGAVDLYGQVGSLLEVGTGFHPELTGRENVFLSGAILGMRRAEIATSFDDIVGFSEVEAFIDTPVKYFSSGMYLRLAFAVAVHLRPSILIVDEVLAVGDAQFQRKCLAKMQEVTKSGRTVLFVSHNLSAVRNICTRGIVMDGGRLVDDGPVDVVIDGYLARLTRADASDTIRETAHFTVEAVRVTAPDAPVIKTFRPIAIVVRFRPKIVIRDPGLYVGFLSLDNQRIAGLDFKDHGTHPSLPAGEVAELGFSIESLPLLPGTYQIEIHLKDMASHLIEVVPGTFSFEVVETPVYGGRKLDHWFGNVGLKACTVAAEAGRSTLETASAS